MNIYSNIFEYFYLLMRMNVLYILNLSLYLLNSKSLFWAPSMTLYSINLGGIKYLYDINSDSRSLQIFVKSGMQISNNNQYIPVEHFVFYFSNITYHYSNIAGYIFYIWIMVIPCYVYNILRFFCFPLIFVFHYNLIIYNHLFSDLLKISRGC